MLANKRSGLTAALTLGIAATLAGCSDYPSDGVIDTKVLRSKAEIIEVEGSVYGLKPGALDLRSALTHDRRVLRNAFSAGIEAHEEGKDLPTIDLKGNADTVDFDVDAFQSDLAAAITQYTTDVDAKQAEGVKEAEAQRDKLQARMEEMSAAASKHDSYVAEAAATVKEAEENLSKAIEAYNEELSKPLEELNSLAAKNGLNELPARANPINRYRTLDLTNKAMPATCPKKVGHIAIDMRKETQTCGYVRMSSHYKPIYDAVPGIIKPALIALPKLQEELGKKGSWGRDATGAYGELAKAKKVLKGQTAMADKKFGDNFRRDRKQKRLKRKLERAGKTVAHRESDDYRNNVKRGIYPSLPEESDAVIDEYLSSLHGHLDSHIEQGPSVVLNGNMAEFSGLDGGYEAAVIVAEFIVESGSRRDTATSVHFVDLTDENVKEAGEIRVDLDKRSISSGYGIDIRNDVDREKAVLRATKKFVSDRERAERRAKQST